MAHEVSAQVRLTILDPRQELHGAAEDPVPVGVLLSGAPRSPSGGGGHTSREGVQIGMSLGETGALR
jgi:hypothetical protein